MPLADWPFDRYEHQENHIWLSHRVGPFLPSSYSDRQPVAEECSDVVDS